ncbi:MAG: YigZ family protein, partial [Ignavibacteriae bacterium]|nr:YigZ family protein [Ignavibacteriota bacterium]
KYFDSAHNPFAYRVGLENVQFRFNDDSEPSGSAGKPILDCIDKFELTDIIIVVSRYFGGVKLGVGGLKRAFFDSAEGCLKNAQIIEKYILKRVSLSFDYKFIGSIMNYIEKNSIHIIENNSGENVNLICDIRLSKLEGFNENIKNLTSGKFIFKEI